MTANLEQKAIKGVGWSLIDRFGLQGVHFIVGIILARLLTPADFGLIGMISVFFAVAQVLVRSGLSQAYIQKDEVSNADANTVFYTNLTISLILYAGLSLSAPVIAAFYKQGILIELIRVMGLIVIINSLGVIQIAQLTREIDFKQIAKISLIATIGSGTCGVVCAYMGLGVWALVLQNILQATLMVTGLYATSAWKPALSFSILSLKKMYSFGFWIVLAGVVRTVFDNIYILTIGKFFPVAQLGFYTKAKQFQRISSQQISNAIGVVAFPIFAQVQDDKAKLQAGMQNFLQYTLFFQVPLLVILMVVAKPFIIILLTAKWAPMIPFLQLLCVAGILRPIHQVNIQVLKAQGKSKLNFNLNIIKNSLRIANIAIMYRFSVMHIIVGEIGLSALALALNTYYTSKMIDYGLRRQIKDIWTILFSGAVAGFIGYAASFWMGSLFMALIIGIVSTSVIYLALQYAMNRCLFFSIMNLRATLRG